MLAFALALALACALERARRRGDERARAALEKMTRARAEERVGRTRAERELRACRLELAKRATTSEGGEETNETYGLRAIGTFTSAFRKRLGTPRQGTLTPLARGRVELDGRVPGSALEGLEEFSHCWLVFLFHENTDFHASVSARRDGGNARALDGGKTTMRGKIRVPRLNGEKRGCLATRSPHRPCPIGLSLVEIVRVGKTFVDVAGGDLVHGSPILDVKPYVPYSDTAANARAPAWVGASVDDGDGPLSVDEVVVCDEAARTVRKAWEETQKHSLYESAEAFSAFVSQALGRDLRSYHHRLKPRDGTENGEGVIDVRTESASSEDEVVWKCALDGVVVSYRHVGKRVIVIGAEKDEYDAVETSKPPSTTKDGIVQ